MAFVLMKKSEGSNSSQDILHDIELISELSPDIIKLLPKHILLQLNGMVLFRFWKDLPKEYQEDDDILQRLPCFEHYNKPDDPVHIDGPAPPKFRCNTCKLNKLSQ